MKAMYDNYKIINIVPDDYIAGNPLYDNSMQPINGLAFELDEGESIMGSALHECKASKYELDSEGILHRADIESTPEYAEYIDKQRKARYEKEVDGLVIEKIINAFPDLFTNEKKMKDEIKKDLPK